ncbi:non-hydrolyzing UDP-N-acetylglucosamine 2-epimerase [Montanilutibacter psychrotolerans]|uniref:UDP-N-acetylglucosamine 2-epimerase (Non-hydrolyzing) n=1 Tax=Montanilutibacter psychrotolerans TaxID=1327343 RepID=A0A3M8SU88_9GAMM|nr:UDP-N-acetylglucosamine 2-epimerase (non-hydrolyzing) [Lysobacter psychrotolerans]RNF84353.1 UDP-N-acetylglucosamine 2-epimerase (non-hydrolyzing) [Lysobacter psychrotolerans]
MSATRRCRVDLIVGTRPNIVKLGPLAHALSASDWCDPRVVFLEQHTNAGLGDDILADLGVDADHVLRIPLPGDGYGQRLGDMVAGYGEALRADTPDLVVVFGDVDATLAAALAAKRHGLPVAHVEAGLRSHDRRMPEELNRLMVDAIADLFFATSEDAVDTLVRSEGKPADAVHFVGNLMIDSLVRTLDADAGARLGDAIGLPRGGFAVATFHRPSNVDHEPGLRAMLSLLQQASTRLPVVLPLHPRTAAALDRHGLRAHADGIDGLHLLPPIRYREFISLLSHARVAMTDSGGLQEETSFLGVPCLTVRENTERPVTITLGTNCLTSPAEAIGKLDAILQSPRAAATPIPLWDGNTAGRMTRVLSAWWADQQRRPGPSADLG